MNYISDCLCHFVGRSCANDDERFELLVKIIKEHQLKANLKNPDNPEMCTSSRYKGERLGEILEKCDCVCFCDIPDEMLQIHTSKYSRFGMGFNKTFLSQNGVRPVMYVPSSAKIKEPCKTDTPKENPNEYYLYLHKISYNVNPILMLLNGILNFGEKLHAIMKDKELVNRTGIPLFDKSILRDLVNGKAHSFIFSETIALSTQCAYIKIFDETLADDDPDNYYMEREWRSLKSVDFELSNIQKIYLPSNLYREKFMTEFPEYSGEFWLFDEQ